MQKFMDSVSSMNSWFPISLSPNYKPYKLQCSSNIQKKILTEHVITMWNACNQQLFISKCFYITCSMKNKDFSSYLRREQPMNLTMFYFLLSCNHVTLYVFWAAISV